jgi:WD40-like Beta Propeller Repeat
VPPPVRALIRRCLEKDRRARVADIAAASFVVKDHALLTASADRADQVSRGAAEAQLQSTVLAARRETARAMNRRTVLAAGLAPLLGMVAAAATLLYTMRPPAPRVVRTTIPLPFDGRPEDVMRSLAITPDGSRIVYAVDRQQLFVRALDQDNAVPLTSSSSGMGAQAAFISPDGQWVGFRDTTLMKKLAINGGPP